MKGHLKLKKIAFVHCPGIGMMLSFDSCQKETHVKTRVIGILQRKEEDVLKFLALVSFFGGIHLDFQTELLIKGKVVL